jgi:2-C-methyl-D-erythritol 4-phosphate cytidylyltransferase
MPCQSVSAILLAGGAGQRMQSAVPKQFLLIKNKPIVRYSFDLFLSMVEISEIVVVCDPQYRHFFELPGHLPKKVTFALPGTRRQDSVYHGLQGVSTPCDLVCIHDSARPIINRKLVLNTLDAAQQHGAATVGLPIRYTIKERDEQGTVKNTPDRSLFWEIQTPQVICYDLLQKGFQYAIKHGITVTDDVSLVELLNEKVKLVEGSPDNLKITVPLDLQMAAFLLDA